MKQCPECSARNEDENTFCQSCGATLPDRTSKVIEPVGTVGVTPGIEEKRASKPPPAKDAEEPKVIKSKSKTMLGIPAVTGPRRTPSQKILAPTKIKQRRDKTLMGMADEIEDIPLKDEEAAAEPPPEAIKPIMVKGISAAPPGPDVDDVEVSVERGSAAFNDVEVEEEKAAAASKDLAKKVDELFAEESASEGKTEAAKAEPKPEEKPVPAPARKSAPPRREEKREEDRPAPAKRAAPPAVEQEPSRSGYWLVAVLLVIAAVIGYYYYTRNNGQGKDETQSGGAPAAEEKSPPAEAGEQAPAPPENEPVKYKVLLQGLPDKAVVTVDDVIQLQNPVVLQPTDSPRVFKIEAPGYAPWVKAVSVQSDATLRVDMKTAAAAAAEAEEAARAAEQAEAAAAAEAGKKPEEASTAKKPKDKTKKKKKKKKAFPDDYNPYDD